MKAGNKNKSASVDHGRRRLMTSSAALMAGSLAASHGVGVSAAENRSSEAQAVQAARETADLLP